MPLSMHNRQFARVHSIGSHAWLSEVGVKPSKHDVHILVETPSTDFVTQPVQ